MIIKLYQFATFVFGPFVDVFLRHRLKQGKEDPLRIKERMGYASIKRPEGKLVWVHAASVGESLSVLPLVHKIASLPDIRILFTTGTTSSAQLIENKLPDNVFHQYSPVDKYTAVRRFLSHWKPDLALWVESELWPNLVIETHKYCKMLLINGRISNNSYNKWKKYPGVVSEMLQSFSLVLPQSEIDSERFSDLGATHVKYIGNLKYDAPPLPSNSKVAGGLIAEIGERPVWFGASTHSGEEELLVDTHISLKEDFPELLTIIAPRHPNRIEHIISNLSDKKITIAQRSKEQKIEPETDVYFVDTMGELGDFYRLVSIVFIGGSLVAHGGQNPLEAIRLECAVIFGPYMDNFLEIKRDLEKNNAAIKVKDKHELLDTMRSLFNDHNRLDTLISRSKEVLVKRSDILEKYNEHIGNYL